MSNARRIRLSAGEALAEPIDQYSTMATSHLLTTAATVTFGTSADFSAGSVFSLTDTENNPSPLPATLYLSDRSYGDSLSNQLGIC